MKNTYVKLLCVAAAALTVAACGVKSQPVAPEGSVFPRDYPTPLPPLTPTGEKPSQSGQPTYTPSDPNSFWQYPNTPPGQ